MAVTKIWKIEGWLGDSLIYIENPEKTRNPMVVGNPNLEKSQYQAMDDVIEYASNDDGEYHGMERFVTGVNCSADTARAEMIATKEAFGKNDSICGYHGIQSFMPGEVTPEIAHEIGVKLAQKMWGDHFQIVVATHLDHDHIHNHFIVNSVAFTDGHRLWKEKNYWKMRAQSDELCREYGLSITVPKNRGKQYAEWKAEREKNPTQRSLLRKDIDRILLSARSLPEFYDKLQEAGYTVNTEHKYVTIRPPGAERNIRLQSLGEAYTEEALYLRILKNRIRPQYAAYVEPCRIKRVRGKLPHKKAHGMKALYYKWLYYLGVFGKRKPQLDSSAFVTERRRLDGYIRQMNYISEHNLRSILDIDARRTVVLEEIAGYVKLRDELRKQIRGKSYEDPAVMPVLEKIVALNKTLKEKRSEVRLCEQIKEWRQKIIKQIRAANEYRSFERRDIQDGRTSDYSPEYRRNQVPPSREQGNSGGVSGPDPIQLR
ncbi:MAG: relaxase/mobilization nuclease domain-containing protein [Hominenteromicrobium sp.]|uniref:relaxase/mobilization nuclease domain-containing protein n=2 Tax=Oscillospiraceae TaxID=216572 RepID=UPI00399286B7